MQTQSRFTQISALALGIASAFAFGQADAAGFQLKENSVKAMGRAFAGSAAAPGDASVVVNNPAAMTQFDKNTVQADITVVDLSADLQRRRHRCLRRLPLTGGDGGDAGDVTPDPGAARRSSRLGDIGLTFGAMVSAPFGLKTEYENGWVGRYHALKSEVETRRPDAVGLARHHRPLLGRCRRDLRACRGGRCPTPSISVRRSAPIRALPACCAALPAPCTARSSRTAWPASRATTPALAGSPALHWRPTDKLTIGYSHRSEIDHELEGDATFSRAWRRPQRLQRQSVRRRRAMSSPTPTARPS